MVSLLWITKNIRTAAFRFSTRSMSTTAPYLLNASEVKSMMDSNKLVSVLDTTWFMPNSPQNARNGYLTKRIPGAQFLDLDEVASPHELGLKHMMPTGRCFADACESLGVSPSSHVVLYDQHGVFSSPRALFMFRAFGHGNSSVLDGGLPAWEAEGLSIEADAPRRPDKSTYETPMLDERTIRSYEQMVQNASLGSPSQSSAELVLDARPQGRYLGRDPEPRPGLSSGHIPHSFSLPFTAFLQKRKAPSGAEYTTFLSRTGLERSLIDAVGAGTAQLIIKAGKPVITSCGSGMTAGVLWLGLQLLGIQNVGLYDESWTGYAMRPTSKIEKS